MNLGHFSRTLGNRLTKLPNRFQAALNDAEVLPSIEKAELCDERPHPLLERLVLGVDLVDELAHQDIVAGVNDLGDKLGNELRRHFGHFRSALSHTNKRCAFALRKPLKHGLYLG